MQIMFTVGYRKYLQTLTMWAYSYAVGYIDWKNYDTLSNLRRDGYNTKDAAALLFTHHIQFTRDIAVLVMKKDFINV